MGADFETEFCSDAEFEQVMDDIIDSLRDYMESDDEKAAIINGLKFKQIQFAYAALKYITRGNNVELSYRLNEPFRTMGSISVEGKILEFDNPEWFSRVAEFATNTEIYPLAKNKVRLTFTFHGLATPIE